MSNLIESDVENVALGARQEPFNDAFLSDFESIPSIQL